MTTASINYTIIATVPGFDTLQITQIAVSMLE